MLRIVTTPLVLRVRAFTMESAAPSAPAYGLPPDPAYKLASEHLARLADADPAYRHDVQRHAA